MDKRNMIGAISLSLAVFVAWYLFVGWYDRNHPQPVSNAPATTQPIASPTPAATQPGNTTNPTTQTTTITATGLSAVEAVDQSTPEILLGSTNWEDGTYALQLKLTPLGAGVESATLNEFPSPESAHEKKDKKSQYQFETPLADVANTRVLATRLISINHKEIDLSTKRWNIGTVDAGSAQFFIYVDDLNGHLAKVTKTFRVSKRDAADGNKGYEVAMTQEITDARPAGANANPALTVHSIINGPTPPPAETDSAGDQTIATGFVEKSSITVEPNTLGEFKKEELPAHVEGNLDPAPVNEPAHSIYTKQFSWIGQTSSYFAATVLSADPSFTITGATESGTGPYTLVITTSVAHGYSAGDKIVIEGVAPAAYNNTWVVTAVTPTTFTVSSPENPGNYVKGGTAQRFDFPPKFNARIVTVDTGKADLHSAAISFETTDQPVSANAGSTTSMTVYFGPKWREVLNDEHYVSFPRMYEKLLEFKSRLCGFMTWDWLIFVLVGILRLFHHLLHDWGVSIICLVLIVRTLLHPITKRSQVQMMKMGKLTPEVEKLKKKYADKPEELNREMMKLYKQQSGAMLGCLPMFLQTPIWIALYTALQGTFELRQAPFLEFHGHALTWIHDLAKPDTLINLTQFHDGQPIPLIFGWHLWSINLLPILMAIVTYINQKYFMPMPIAATPEQAQQQKMQRGMSLFFPLMFYAMPSGLNLYYLTSMSLGILESKIIRKHIKEQEELAKAEGPEIVTMGKPPRGFRDRGAGGASVSKGPKNPQDDNPGFMGRMMLALQKAQEQAEQMRKDKEKGKGKK